MDRVSECTFDVMRGTGRAQDVEPECLESAVASQPLEEVVSIMRAQAQVHQDQVPLAFVECFAARGRSRDDGALGVWADFPERFAQQLRVSGVVFDEENVNPTSFHSKGIE